MNESGELEPMLPKKVNLNDRLKLLINQAPVMVFMKGKEKENYTPCVYYKGFFLTI